MAQFSIHRNRNPRTKATFPLLLDVQSDLLEELKTRVVIPLSRVSALTRHPVDQLMPVLNLEGEAYVLVTPQLAGMAHGELGPAIGSLTGERNTILAALDFLLTGI
jgi:toxin CcdB